MGYWFKFLIATYLNGSVTIIKVGSIMTGNNDIFVTWVDATP